MSCESGSTMLVLVHELELDLANAEAVGASVAAEAATTQAARIDVDLHEVEFLDAFAIGQLVALRTSLARSGRTLLLRNLNRGPRRVLAVMGLLDGFTNEG